ncbi:MAG: ATP-binding cassette domain-containing protein, partial [Oscillospiraceae bacterium]|nr:ATP-binding cassette domain-containing protein [Oscillospiraceae bacterium]
MVSLNDVSMTYRGGAHAANHLSLEIQDGEFVFLVGPSGSGKTTIIKLLTGEVQAEEGALSVNGYDMRTIRRRQLPELRRTLGVIFQDFRLIEDRNVYGNVAFAMHVIGARRREIRERVPYVLKLVGLENREKRLPRELSGGEQQRVAVARALVYSPRLIIADEPTGY